MEKFAELKALVEKAEVDVAAFYAKGNKAAGTRVRQAMQELKNLAQEIRVEIQQKKSEG